MTEAAVVILYPNELIELANGIRENRTLKELTIEYTHAYVTFDDNLENIEPFLCQAADDAVTQLATNLQDNHSITALTLNGFSNKGLAAMSTGLEKNTTLTSLEISADESTELVKYGKKGFSASLNGLQKNHSIKCLLIDSKLEGVSSDLTTVFALANYIKNNKTVNDLKLIGAHLSEKGGKEIGNALAESKLESLSFVDCSQEGSNGLASLLTAFSKAKKHNELKTLSIYQAFHSAQEAAAAITSLAELISVSSIKNLHISLPGYQIQDDADPQVLKAIDLLLRSIENNHHIVNITALELTPFAKPGSGLQGRIQNVKSHCNQSNKEGKRKLPKDGLSNSNNRHAKQGKSNKYSDSITSARRSAFFPPKRSPQPTFSQVDNNHVRKMPCSRGSNSNSTQ